jgi:hypothetical protein
MSGDVVSALSVEEYVNPLLLSKQFNRSKSAYRFVILSASLRTWQIIWIPEALFIPN